MKEFKKGDKIDIGTGYDCDKGVVIRDNGDTVTWTSDVGGGTYTTPKAKYNITKDEPKQDSEEVKWHNNTLTKLEEKREAIIARNIMGWTLDPKNIEAVRDAMEEYRQLSPPEQKETQEELWRAALLLIGVTTDFRQSTDGRVKGLGNLLLKHFTIQRNKQ